MARTSLQTNKTTFLPPGFARFLERQALRAGGLTLMAGGTALLGALASYDPADPSLNRATDIPAANWLGGTGANVADLMLQGVGLAALLPALCLLAWGGRLLALRMVVRPSFRLLMAPLSVLFTAMTLAAFPAPLSWPVESGLGGLGGTLILQRSLELLAMTGIVIPWGLILAGFGASLGLGTWLVAMGLTWEEWYGGWYLLRLVGLKILDMVRLVLAALFRQAAPEGAIVMPRRRPVAPPPSPPKPEVAPKAAVKPSRREMEARQGSFDLPGAPRSGYEFPPLSLLTPAVESMGAKHVNQTALTRNAQMLESVLKDFGVQGTIVKVRPGPVVTLYELDPAPGTKTARVVGLADDIARSMSAVSVRIAVVPGSSVIGIELPNAKREMVYLRELLSGTAFERTSHHLPLGLGKDIGGAPVYVDLARMPHLLIAGTTGSGKSVAVNTMILSLLYRLSPQECRMIMIDPKMLELSVYDGIPHLLSPVVTDPNKAVVALKWAVREMEDRYRCMSQLGVRNINGYNQKLIEARKKGQSLTRTVQTGFDGDTGKPVYEEQDLNLDPLPFIVVIVDEMADLMLVAGKDVEAAIQRLAQMARAAGIHLIMATQRPSVDVITGTIKANFPTRVSFQVTSKIDSRTILGEQGAEQLLGQGDMLYMAPGGRIGRVHGPFVSDDEVEAVAHHLRCQGEPDYVESVTEEDGSGPEILGMSSSNGESGDDLYDQAVALVLRERKASTSFVQRYLQIGYNRAARLIERMEADGVIGKPNHVGKREVLAPNAEEAY